MDLAAVLDKTLAARKEMGRQKLPRIAQTWADSLAGIANTRRAQALAAVRSMLSLNWSFARSAGRICRQEARKVKRGYYDDIDFTVFFMQLMAPGQFRVHNQT